MSISAATLLVDMTTAHASGQEDVRPHQAAIDWQAALAAHDRWLRMVVRTRLGDWQAVDEVLQEVSLAAVPRPAPLADPSKVRPAIPLGRAASAYISPQARPAP